jgi:hypothetical protein
METKPRFSHHLKTWPPYFEAVVIGLKKFEIRRRDRSFEPGDLIFLKEYDPNTAAGYTGRAGFVRIGYILKDFEGLRPEYCAISLEPFEEYKPGDVVAYPAKTELEPWVVIQVGNAGGKKVGPNNPGPLEIQFINSGERCTVATYDVKPI